uniref:EF-hand domain-containing protein n=1 Tax=Ananas comosus var. bracteatus TaxID=296719 RepID=A0A6V7QP05_ANACO|nr:unnamed protein product [Ananas comosus var. bracteatus]
MEEERIGAAAGTETETREREREGEGEGEYEDLMAVMAERLDAEEFMQELRAGFRVLAEEGRGVITAESLRRRAREVLGLEGMTAEEAEAMVREGDLDGDGALGRPSSACSCCASAPPSWPTPTTASPRPSPQTDYSAASSTYVPSSIVRRSPSVAILQQ